MGGQGPVEIVGVHVLQTTSKLSGAVSSPIAGPCGGMDAATEPTWTYLRRVPRAVRAPRPRPARFLIAPKRRNDSGISVVLKCMESADRSVTERLICDSAAGPLPAHHRGTRRKYVRVGSYAASMPRKVPRRWAGKDQSRWSVRVALFQATSKLSGEDTAPSTTQVTVAAVTSSPCEQVESRPLLSKYHPRTGASPAT
ncbi:hypothetical protein CFBP8129_08560 [Xanthomonas hortorum pv. gardneri]|uniref:Uncharacterized protein n=1 Tax=Xanthomonas hortorum pv. gardneri TaxID=2754056 RepID=A0A6V7C1Q3_9XANT|nr:hypothetical protein CFBP8129_08560 [Xanthomonas hortorum pv. gardneri]CAD0308005.1 hypothetical protein CFBP8129_08560 [Xanthomonas hortorum pv. gardneri]CAH2709743.1 hypothetical protein NCPPB1935_18545 [Xanthomonas campestris pv. nigromaculans]